MTTKRWPLGLFLLLAPMASGCAGAGDGPDTLSDAASLDGSDAGRVADTVLRVHYPLGTGKSLAVRGSVSPLSWGSGQAMTALGGNTFELRVRNLRAGTTLEWKPLVGDATWSRGSNYVVKAGQTLDVYPHFYTGSGRYVRYINAFHSATLGNDRGIWLYLPPSFDENTLARYPVVYMHDGQNLFDPAYAFGGRTWQVSETLNAGIDVLDASQHLPEVVVVGAENTADRIAEYTPTADPSYGGGNGDSYLRFLRDELKPAMEGDALLKGRLYTDRDHTALIGSSLGGLITAYAGITQAATWSRLGIFSPSSWWDNDYIINAVAAAGGVTPRSARVYVDSGSPSDDTAETATLAQKYRDIGYSDGKDLQYVLAPGAQHNEDAWAARLPAALRFLLSGW